MDQSTYLYRCTEQQLEEHLLKVVDAGDVVEHVIFKGGRDYVLVCRNTSAADPVLQELRKVRELLEARLSPPLVVRAEARPVGGVR